MGRASLIIVLGFIVIFGMVRGNMNRTSEQAAENSAEFAEAVLARRITNSATQYALYLQTQTGAKDTTFVDTSWLSGSYTATITSIGSDTVKGTDTLDFTVTGQLGDESHTSLVRLVSRSLLVPEITAAVGVQSDSTLLDLSGNIRVYGNDTNMDGTTGPAPDLPGITVSNPADTADLFTEYGGTTFIQGEGSSPSIGVDSSTTDLQALLGYYADIADFSVLGDACNQSWGSQGSPVVVYVTGHCELRGNRTGYGVLAVNGSMELGGFVRWYGLIIVLGTALTDFEANGTPAIYGALLVGATSAAVELTGTADLYYSSEAIQMVRESLAGRDRRTVSEMVWWE